MGLPAKPHAPARPAAISVAAGANVAVGDGEIGAGLEAQRPTEARLPETGEAGAVGVLLPVAVIVDLLGCRLTPLDTARLEAAAASASARAARNRSISA